MRKAKDWGQPCPHPACPYDTLRHRANIKAIASYQTHSGTRRIFVCQAWGAQCSETRDTVFDDLRTPEEQVMLVLKLLLCTVARTSLSFALGVTEETVLAWLQHAAEKAAEVNQHLLRAVNVTEVQWDELWSFIARKHSTKAGSDGRQWGWGSLAPECRLMLAASVGPRTFQSALILIPMTAAAVLGGPCFFSDGCSSSRSAVVPVSQQVQEVARTGKRGRPRKPVQEPPPDLGYAHLLKQKRHGHLQGL